VNETGKLQEAPTVVVADDGKDSLKSLKVIMAIFSYDSALAWARDHECGEGLDPSNPEDRDRYTFRYKRAREKAKEEFIALIQTSESKRRIELLKYVLKNGRGELITTAVEAVREHGLSELSDVLCEIFEKSSTGARRAILTFLADHPAQRSYAFLRAWREKVNEQGKGGGLRHEFELLQEALYRNFPVVAWADGILSNGREHSLDGFNAQELWGLIKEIPSLGDAIRLGCAYLSTAAPETTETFVEILQESLRSGLNVKGLPQDAFRAGLLLIDQVQMEEERLQKITSWLHRTTEKDRRECLQVLPLRSAALLLRYSLSGAPQHVRQGLKLLEVRPEVVPELYDSLLRVVRGNDDFSLDAAQTLLLAPERSRDLSEINSWLSYWLIFGDHKRRQRVCRIIATTTGTVTPHLFALPEPARNLLVSICREHNPRKLATLLCISLRESPVLSKTNYLIAIELCAWLEQCSLVTRQLEAHMARAILRTIVDNPASISWIREGLFSFKSASRVIYEVFTKALEQLGTCADSGPNRPPIPILSDHPFRKLPTTDSGNNRPLIPETSDHRFRKWLSTAT